MKSNLFFTLFFLFITQIYSQWSAVNNGLTSLQIKGIGAAGSSIIAVTNGGIFKSTDNGNNWSLHPQNSQITGTIYSVIPDPLGQQGVTLLGSGFIVVVLENEIFAFASISGLPNNKISAWVNEEGGGIPESAIIGTSGGGVFWADNLGSTTWTAIPGLPNNDAKYITGLWVGDDSNNNEYLVVGTLNGAYITPANTLSNLSPFNTGLSGDALIINKLFGNFALTKNGIYRADDDGNILNGWQTLYPSGDFRDMTLDFFGQKFYFFGNNIGISANDSGINLEDLTGIQGFPINCALAFYPNLQPQGYLFVGTQSGGVFRKPITATSVDDNIVINDFKLEQNFPNPFNPSTKISWQSPVGGYTTLKVYDVLGNEVATLVDEYKNAGSYEVEFNAGQTISLSSGVYFYRVTIHSDKIQTENFVQTKKMILTK